MNVLLTGSFGNIGRSTLKVLLKKNYQVTCFDLPSKPNRKIEKKLQKKYDFITLWGDIQNQESVVTAVKNQDCIIHLAGITPPLTQKKPELAHQINVLGTENLIKEALKQKKQPKIIFSSSISIYGPQAPDFPPRNSEQQVNPIDVYTSTKVETERLIINSNLPWTIFRITAVPSLSLKENEMELLYNIPMEQKIEFIHPYDVGQALANAVKAETEGRILMIGGGRGCQYINRTFVSKYLKTLGIGMLPEAVFRIPKRESEWFYTNWLETEESQKLLKYQKHTFDDYLLEIKRKLILTRIMIRLFRSFIRKILIKRSPYYEFNVYERKYQR
jgi:nucleoside-diphosphate-sugar epimerase